MYCARSSGVACQVRPTAAYSGPQTLFEPRVYAASMQCRTYAIPLARMLSSGWIRSRSGDIAAQTETASPCSRATAAARV